VPGELTERFEFFLNELSVLCGEVTSSPSFWTLPVPKIPLASPLSKLFELPCRSTLEPGVHIIMRHFVSIIGQMRYLMLFLLLFIVTACGSKPTPDPEAQIREIVAATLAALPKSTPSPPPSPVPSSTPVNLAGLFCEYQFCIGHPSDMAYYDVSAVTSNQGTPSTYQTGLMAAYSGNLLMQLMWQFSPGAADPRFLLDLILEDGLDTSVGTPEVKLVRDMNVVYTSITTTATPILPFGGAAAWTCGDRVFAWKVYTLDEASPPSLFEAALDRFTCNR